MGIMGTETAPLEGQAALITGGGSGIGLQSARYLARDGAAVTICGRSLERVVGAIEDLRNDPEVPEGAVLQAISCDVENEEQVAAAVALAAEPLEGLHIVVASAGTGTVGPLVAMDLNEFNRVLTANVSGTFLTIKHGGAELVRSGGGSIVAISSLAGRTTHRFMGPYCAAKAAIDMLANVAADELGSAGVRVNTVQPSLVATDLVTMITAEDHIRNDYLSQMPVSRVGTVDDVAAMVRFLCGPESGWMTGANIPIDGGHHLRRGPDYEPIASALYGDAVNGLVARP
jgi:NAD(P)-dependent dehydrogenase (short-subunit alcohol dehydrogenase family)